MVLKKLEGNGLVVRSLGAHDRRRHSLQLTRSGERLLSLLIGPARRAQARLLSALTPGEQTLFLQLLDKLTHEFNNPHGFRLIRPGLAKGRPRTRGSRALFELRKCPNADDLLSVRASMC
jgi:hypothetical protein